MSRQPQVQQVEVSTKRQIASILIITGLIFGAWWSLTGIIDLISGGSRGGYKAEENLSDVGGGTYGLYPIAMPPFPNIDLQSLLNNLSPDQLQQLMDMLGGNLNTLDPSMLAGLLGSNPAALNTVMFRIYDYPSQTNVQSLLFRYSVYDSFSDTDWTKTYPGSTPDSYSNSYILPNVTPEYRLRIPLGTITPGQEYTTTIPGVSPEAYIRSGSVHAQNPSYISSSLDPNSVVQPYVDDFGVQSLKPRFNTGDSQNISVNTWGFQRAGGDVFYNTTTRVNPSIIDAGLLARYTAFPGGVTASQYRATRPAFAAATVDIQNRFDTNPSANLFVKANMIRNYIQETFSCDPFSSSSASDIVENTCQTKVGDYYAIASTYIMLARYFGIPARFATGYSGHLASESVDPMGTVDYSGPQNTVEIKLLNMYAWAETFMPIQDDGTGDWVPIDVLQVSFADGYSNGLPIGTPPPPGTVMRMWVNGTEFNPVAPMYSVDRPTVVNITVNVTMNGTPYDGPVTLYDMLEEQTLSVITATSGWGQFLWNINTTVIAGGHGIRGSAGALMNFTAVGVRGPINLQFVDRIPDTIYRPSPNQDLRVIGYLEDVAYTGSRPTNRIPKANITVALFTNPGNNPVSNPFIPDTVKTNETGEFATNVTLNPSVVNGSYNVRLTFPGLFTFTLPGIGMASAFVAGMTAMSITKPLDVIDPNQVIFDIYLNGTDNSVYDTLYNEGDTINVTVHILIGGNPVSLPVNFSIQDNRNAINPLPMGTTITDLNGWGTVTWTVLPAAFTGPAIVRAQFNKSIGDVRSAYMYCFINRSTTLYLNAIIPDATIDINGNPYLGFTANINDTYARGVWGAQVWGMIYDLGSNPSTFTISPTTQGTNTAGNAVWSNYSTIVQGSGDLGYYDLRTEFYGVYNFNTNPWSGISGLSPGFLYVPGANTNNSLKRQIFITDSSNITLCNLWVNSTPAAASYNDGNIGVFKGSGSIINFTAQCRKGLTFTAGESVEFYDNTWGKQLGIVYTNSFGIATLLSPVNSSWLTGPHEITMTYRINPGPGQRSNYTVVFINNTIHLDNTNIYVDQPQIVRDVTTLHVTGALKDANGQGVYKASVNLGLFDSSFVQQFGYINGFTTAITDKNGNFTFTFTLSNTLPQGAYKFRVDYAQVIDANSFSHCPTYLTGVNKLNAVQSPYKDVTVNATVGISSSYYTPLNPLQYSYIDVYGTFQWDNGTAFQNYLAGWITIQVTEAGNPNNILSTTTILTSEIDGSGNVVKSIQVTWSQSFVVKWIFTPSDAYVTRASVDATGV